MTSLCALQEADLRPSDYQVAGSSDPHALRELLSNALGALLLDMRKRRTLLVLDTTRIHLDNGDRLGGLPIEATNPNRNPERTT